MGENKEDIRLFPVKSSGRTRGNEHKMKYGIFHLNIKNLPTFTVSMT